LRDSTNKDDLQQGKIKVGQVGIPIRVNLDGRYTEIDILQASEKELEQFLTMKVRYGVPGEISTIFAQVLRYARELTALQAEKKEPISVKESIEKTSAKRSK